MEIYLILYTYLNVIIFLISFIDEYWILFWSKKKKNWKFWKISIVWEDLKFLGII